MPPTPDERIRALLTPIDAARVDAAFEAWRRDGIARIEGAVPGEVLELLRARIDAIMLGEITHEGLFFQHDSSTGRYEDAPIGQGWQGPSRSYRKIEKLERDPLFCAHLSSPLMRQLVRKQITDGPVNLYRAIVMTKSEAGGSNLPWHQDGGTFWGLDRDPELQIWTALDDAPREAGCVEAVLGSHRAGLATKLGGVIPDDVTRDPEAVAFPANAGDLLLIHNYVWHRSGRNLTGRPRRALSVCYMPASIRCVRKKRAPRAFFRVFDA